jgi:hypothetical protein
MYLRRSSVADRASEQCAERTDWGQNHIGSFLSIWLLLIVQSVPVNHDYEMWYS